MNNLISIWDLKIHSDKTLSKKSLFLIEALNKMNRNNQFHEESFEKVICPFELILTLIEIVHDYDARRGNENAIK